MNRETLVRMKSVDTTKEAKSKLGIKVDKQYEGMWSFGVCLSHWGKETYIYLNLFKLSVSIGWMVVDGEV